MNFTGNDWRSRRNLLNHSLQDPLLHLNHYSIAGYCTEQQKMNELNMLPEDVLHNFHLMHDPLRKNLADTLIGAEEKPSKIFESPPKYNMDPPKIETKNSRQETYPSFAGITNFISGVFSVLTGAVFHKRAKSPTSQYKDCYDSNNHITQSLNVWHSSRIEDQNIIEQGNRQSPDNSNKMNTDCKTAVSSCEDKLKELKELLAKKKQKNEKKVEEKENNQHIFENGTNGPEIVESCEEKFEDALSSPILPQTSPQNRENGIASNEDMEIVKTLPNSDILAENNDITELHKDELSITKEVKNVVNNEEKSEDSTKIKNEKDNKPDNSKTKEVEVIHTCEDKLTDLQALMQDKSLNTPIAQESRTQESVTKIIATKPPIPIPIKPDDKRFKNSRLVEKRKKCSLSKNVNDDMKFAHEIDDVPSSVESSPRVTTPDFSPKSADSATEYFDEVVGKFHSSPATDSEDSFQIVFTDSPRSRKVSDCDSEDSFVVFQESPDSCYTTTDVFGDHDMASDAESEQSDSGFVVPCQMSGNLSRTISDLTDDSLYAVDSVKCRDELDCAVTSVCDEIPKEELLLEEVDAEERNKTPGHKGLLVDEAKKLMKKNQPPKKVSFSTEPPKVKVMRVWAFAARQARIGDWQRQILDRDRFKRRIADVDVAISWVLKPQHRSRVMFQRFMPWWNQLRRKEIAEKKEQERLRKLAEEKQRIEDEKRRVEEERLRKEEQERVLEAAMKRLEEDRKRLEREERMKKRPGYQEAQDRKVVRSALMRRSFKRLEKNLARFAESPAAGEASDSSDSNVAVTVTSDNKTGAANGDEWSDSKRERVAISNNSDSKVNVQKMSPTRDKVDSVVISDT